MAFADGLFNRLVVSPDSRAIAMSVLALSAATLAARASAPTASHRRGDALRIHPRRGIAHPRVPAAPRAQHRDDDAIAAPTTITRREAASGAAALALALASPESALATPPRQSFQVSEDQFRPLPGTNPPIMYADIKGGAGAEGGVKAGQRVAVHFDVKFRRITIATSRQGAGVTGGTPYGFTVGVPAGTPGGPFIKALNEGIKGMGPGQFRRLVVPPEYAYGDTQVQEIPPNATLTVDIELLSVAAGREKAKEAGAGAEKRRDANRATRRSL